jgi:hypothetical protein
VRKSTKNPQFASKAPGIPLKVFHWANECFMPTAIKLKT